MRDARSPPNLTFEPSSYSQLFEVSCWNPEGEDCGKQSQPVSAKETSEGGNEPVTESATKLILPEEERGNCMYIMQYQ